MFLPSVPAHGCLDRPHQDLIPFLFHMHSLFFQPVGLVLNLNKDIFYKVMRLDHS